MCCDRRPDQTDYEEAADFGSPHGRSGDPQPAAARGEVCATARGDDSSAASGDDDSARGDEGSADYSIGAHG